MQDDEAVGRLARGRDRVKRKTMETLLLAFELQQRAAAVGFDWPDARGPLEKVKEELGELERATGDGQRATIEEEVGDLLFAVVNLARKLDIDPQAALEQANGKFKRRFEQVERLAEQRGLEMGRATLGQPDRPGGAGEGSRTGRPPGGAPGCRHP